MRRLVLAVRAFFLVLLRAEVADRVQQAIEAGGGEAAEQAAERSREAPRRPAGLPSEARRSEALTLLAALQREARLVDLVQEPLDGYSDAQIGAAARSVLRDCGVALDRMFGLEPVVQAAEGADVEVPAGFEPQRYRLVGDVRGEPPYRGQLVHHGWRATRVELPSWSGSPPAANVVAAAEVEIR